jgi:AraC family transcriptional regulator, transcriptional activator of pobA
LSGSTAPLGAFPFSPQDPRYGATASSADFTAIVLHTSGPSLSMHRGVRTIRAGDVHVLARGEVHQVLDFGRAEGIAVALQVERFAADLAPRLDALPVVVRPAKASFNALLERAQAIHTELHGERAHSATAALAHAQLFLVELLRDAPELPASSGPVREALRFVERQHHRPISLRDAAAAVHYSPRQLAEKVRRETGQSVGDWLTLFRLAHARTLLRTSDLAVEAVALEVGYADVTHFIRTFRRDERMTPARWRRTARSALQPPEPRPRAQDGAEHEAPRELQPDVQRHLPHHHRAEAEAALHQQQGARRDRRRP